MAAQQLRRDLTQGRALLEAHAAERWRYFIRKLLRRFSFSCALKAGSGLDGETLQSFVA
jgi:hypothetical protein